MGRRRLSRGLSIRGHRSRRRGRLEGTRRGVAVNLLATGLTESIPVFLLLIHPGGSLEARSRLIHVLKHLIVPTSQFVDLFFVQFDV